MRRTFGGSQEVHWGDKGDGITARPYFTAQVTSFNAEALGFKVATPVEPLAPRF